ncbi:MAG: magnesium transporter, partial [Oscillospiraceae bacterium]|nr:magnesium transporter [Oscillospiraceae bacterium]
CKIMLVDRLLLGNPITLSVALVVCLTMAMTVLMAKVVGCTLPLAAKKIGFDPAVMASPFITTIVDALSLLVYFGIASALLF